MKITLNEITIRNLAANYHDDGEFGVFGYDNKLNIRPPYQREFIYNTKQRDAVIQSIYKGFPINVMYWNYNSDGMNEVMDGQQRTISICQYINGDFSFSPDGAHPYYFNDLTDEERERILNYKLQIYVCEGTEREKLDWFQIINIAGEELTDQELRNAVYIGKWLYDAKKYFSKSECAAYKMAKDYMSGSPIRQDYLETVLKWAVNREIPPMTIEDFMSKHRGDSNAYDLWSYFDEVISWAKRTFPEYNRLMKGIDWGVLYNKYGMKKYDVPELMEKFKELLLDDDVTNKKGIYEYLLSDDEKFLNIRAFSESMKIAAYTKQGGICPICGKHFEIDEMEADHIDPWSAGGKTNSDNCQVLCRSCNRRKSDK